MFVRAVKTAAATPLQTRMPAGRAELAAAPTLAAFAAAVADELAAVQSALIGVQEDFAAHLREGGNSAADVGLLALEAAVQVQPLYFYFQLLSTNGKIWSVFHCRCHTSVTSSTSRSTEINRIAE